ncbi:hypothetical protein OTU49_005299 [Cherax quadricarinatus]|uniref:NADH dehydrogenase [ubiquinone] 1 alpha subcomplex assembly factor 2 n=1 Tax=Cherax quadricarinatus TaxID=27406 RepID=A0AAW0WUJ2_CHEQU
MVTRLLEASVRDPSKGKRHPKRWFVPPAEMRFDQDLMPAEWDAWLRNRRSEPPSESELKENLIIATMKKQNADNLSNEDGRKVISAEKISKTSFPVYDEYEKTPGEGLKYK